MHHQDYGAILLIRSNFVLETPLYQISIFFPSFIHTLFSTVRVIPEDEQHAFARMLCVKRHLCYSPHLAAASGCTLVRI